MVSKGILSGGHMSLESIRVTFRRLVVGTLSLFALLCSGLGVKAGPPPRALSLSLSLSFSGAEGGRGATPPLARVRRKAGLKSGYREAAPRWRLVERSIGENEQRSKCKGCGGCCIAAHKASRLATTNLCAKHSRKMRQHSFTASAPLVPKKPSRLGGWVLA